MKRDKYGSPEILKLFSNLIFAAIVVTFFVFLFFYYRGAVENSRRETARSFIEIFIPAALDYYRQDVGTYPSTLHGIESLWSPPYGVKNWNGPYISPVPLKDPWGYDYLYIYPGDHNRNSYDLWSHGENRSTNADDIRNWNVGDVSDSYVYP